MPQDLAIYPDLSGPGEPRGSSAGSRACAAELTARVDEVLEIIGLTDRAKDRSKEYSGGMKRRLNIGVGLLHRPALLILDEPTVGVDPQSRNSILEAVEALSGEGMAVLYTTHYMEEAERLCDRIGIIDTGRLQAEGTRDELIRLTGGDRHDPARREPATRRGGRGTASIPGVERVDAERHAATLDRRATRPRSWPRSSARRPTAGMTLSDVEISRPDLESVFLHLTGKALRDCDDAQLLTLTASDLRQRVRDKSVIIFGSSCRWR